MQAALAPYLGVNGGVRSDSADHLLADVESGMVKRIFTCPAQEEPAPSLMIAGGDEKWYGPLVPSSYAFNEGLFGFVNSSDHWMRGKLSKARPAAEIVFMSDALPRTEFGVGFIAWMPIRRGKLTLADALTNDNETYKCGVRSQFDFFRHHQKMNVVFCDGHAETLIMTSKELERGVLLSQ